MDRCASNSRRIAIMQPTFAPWLGYFDLLDRVDLFVLLDDVQLSRQSFQTRNRVQGSAPEPKWLPVPHDHSQPIADRLIATTRVKDPKATVDRMCNVLSNLYQASPYLPLVTEMLSLAFENEMLADVNATLISLVAEQFRIATPMIRASSLDVRDRRSERVLGILEAVSWGSYVTVPGAVDYMISDGTFASAVDRVFVEAFEPLEYEQRGSHPFSSHLSVLDALLEVGPERARDVMLAGRRPLKPLRETAG